MEAIKEIRRIIKDRKKIVVNGEKVYHQYCDKCMGQVVHGKRELKEWERLHDEHNKKNLFQKIMEVIKK